jgi:transposase
MMSGITPHGQLYTLTRNRPLTGWESILFLCHLRREIGADLLGIWDGSPIHRSTEVKSFLKQGGAQFVRLEQFPPYAPDLNPDERVWQHLKHVELRNLCCDDLVHLSSEIKLAVNCVRRKPTLIQSFFEGAGLEL